MTVVYLDSPLDDEARRRRLYQGDIFVYSSRPSIAAIAAHAREMIEAAFAPHDPQTIDQVLPVEQCVAVLSKLKPEFIHHPRSKVLIQELLTDLGCDLDKVYFDVPRMRSSMPSDYLTSGIAYAFHPHRDTWYSAPACQLNFWLPVYEVQPENGLAFHSNYFSQGVHNSSRTYNYYQWNAQNRATAAQHIKSDTRQQPKPEEPMQLDPQIRVVGGPGSLIIFSAQQMHSSVPNSSGVARYSIDFRTVHYDDVANHRGAPNVDSACTGTTMRDYLRGSDLSHLPEELVATYDDGTEIQGGVLVYKPDEAVEA